MSYVSLKSAEQLDLQALHRVRSRLVGQRTAVINQIPLRSALLRKVRRIDGGAGILRVPQW